MKARELLAVRFAIVMLGACESPPNTCDQHLVDDLAAIGYLSASSTPESQTAHNVTAIACDGGGSASMDVTGYSGMWGATFTFEACTIGANTDVLTLTGTLTYHNGVNDNDSGVAMGLVINGTVAGCTTAFTETCDLFWSSEPTEPGTNFNYYRRGTLCGRDFP
jgi:hypothetical protein